MLLTITYEGENTDELGFLLHKNPNRAQQFELSFAKAYVFYPEVSNERTTAALLLDIDPIVLARGKVGSRDGGLFDYVNDRPYAASSFMSNAIIRVFSTAMKGKCEKRQELADNKLNLTATVYSLKDSGNEKLAEELFAPLGYTVKTERTLLDDSFPDWGKSPYINLTISGNLRLCELLNHLYVLIPVFDRQKHYYIDESEIKKLLEHGEGWLATHPSREMIIRRYMADRKSFARKAIDIILSDEAVDETEDTAREERTPLNTLRLDAVKAAVLQSGAKSVIDMGCGECRLTAMLLSEKSIERITAFDVSVRTLEKAADRLHLDRMEDYRKNKLTLIQASLNYKDSRFCGYDCACVVEVIEHIEPMRLPSVERNIFEFAAPRTVIVTTPNKEYNENYQFLTPSELRHSDHRFEWTRDEFKSWTERICEKFGYSCVRSEIGDRDENFGCPTQMGVFTKNG